MIYLNLLSITSFSEILKNQKSFKESLLFLQLIHKKFLLCIPSNTPEFLIENGLTFKQGINELSDIELKMLLTTILTNSSMYLGEYSDEYSHEIKKMPFKAFDIYLSMKSEYEIILSLHSEALWESNIIELSKEKIKFSFLNCPKLSSVSRFSDCLDIWEKLLKTAIQQLGKQNGYLCHAQSIKQITPNHISQIYLNELNDPNLKISNIRRLAKFIAETCGYQYDQIVSQKNRSSSTIRDIFFHKDSKVYLSTDIQHGRFEVLDNKGVHLCEINFEGIETKGMDTSGKHNIII